MDGNWSSKLFKNLNCLSCNSQFCIKGFTLKGFKYPWLLNCGHSLCDSCIKQNLKTSTATCPQCQTVYSIDSRSIPEQFSFNLYMIGALTIFQIDKQEKDRKLAMLTGNANFNYSVKGKQPNSDKKQKSVFLCEECSSAAYWSCENCQCYFCDPCWSKAHGAAKSLMKHVKFPITTIVENSKTEYGKCINHEMQDLDLFCKSCRKTVCSYCVIQSHQVGQHSLTTLKEQTSEMVNLLKGVAEEAEMICKRMKHTLQKVKLTQSSPETTENQSLSNLKNQIWQNFARLHGILQLQEEKILKQFQDKSHEREIILNTLSEQLETQIQKTEFLLEKYENFVKKPQFCDLNILYDQLSEVKTLPCYLISQKCNNVNPKITFNESLIKSLENYCFIDLPPNEIFELRSGTDLPEDFAVEPLPVLNYDQRVSAPTSSVSVSDLETFSNCSSRDFHDGSDTFKLNSTKKPNVFCEGRKYSVHITYISNPGEFYVTLNSRRKIKESVEKKAACCGYPLIVSSTICKDDVYLVKYKVDNKWYRGRIKEVLPEKGNIDQTRVVVHYIDYGNTDTVPVSWLKLLPPDLAEEPPLAVKCKLFNCVPKNNKWSKDSVKTMAKIVSGFTATLFVMKIHPDCLEVDLSVIYPDGQIGRDIVSVRDALIFLECASFVGSTAIQDNPPAEKYEEQHFPSVGQSYDVIITHVNSPDDFYLHMTKQDGMFLFKLGAELQSYYNENTQKGVIYNPKIGMPCAAKFSADKKWYRAVIDDLPGKKMVTVYYVDYGNKENISWLDIRKLRENFVKRPPLAIPCALAKIQPKTEDWTPQAKAYLGKCVLTKGFSISVEGKCQTEKKLEVLLFEKLNEKKICVNSLLVELDVTSTSDSSNKSAAEFIARDIPETTDEEEKPKEKYNKDATHEKTKKCKLSAKELREIYESEKRKFHETPAAQDDSISDTCRLKDSSLNVKVEVLSAESPSCIYVAFPKTNEELKNFEIKLNKFYENTTPSNDKEWSVDSKCAVYYAEKKCWCRASISTINDDTVKVFLKDFAKTISVPMSLLRELDPSFTKYGPRAIKCHLANVAPPADKWPGISCEYLESELEKYCEVYMSKKGQIENNSLPVELWVQKVIPASALEPTNVEWTTLNKLLVEKGLAVPKRNLWYAWEPAEESAVVLSSGKEAQSICEKTEPVTESSTILPSLSDEWPQPENLKKTQFTGVPTYVDPEAYIYIQDVEDQEELIKIRDSLREEYWDSKPSPEDHYWSPGQMCIARYFADNEWYRGVVLETSDTGKYKVLFVDYGNVETCQAADLRKRVKMTDVPILVHKLKLYAVSPTTQNGEWPVVVIEVLHSLIVDKKCEVTILPSESNKEPYLATLNLVTEEQDVATILIEEGLATHQLIESESSESINDLNSSFRGEEPTECISEVPSPIVSYVPLTIPEDCKMVHVLVKALKCEDEFYGHLTNSEYLPINLKNLLKQFEVLEETLADECHLQPKLTNIIEGKACCCVHSRINKWCRGEIEIVGDDCVCIFYVDYGYKEFLSADLVHECKSEWQKLPKMAVKFYIPNLSECPNVAKAVYMKALTERLIDNKFLAEILETNGDSVKVELLTEKGGALTHTEIMDVQNK